VKEIISFTQPEDWRHVPGSLNPADLPSRGSSPAELVSSRWWEGPAWLRLSPLQWPAAEVSVNEEEVLTEKKKSKVVVLTRSVGECASPDFLRSSLCYKNLRILCHVITFVKMCKKSDYMEGFIRLEELQSGERVLIGIVQRESPPKKIKDWNPNGS